MAVFTSLDDRGSLLSIEITPAVLDTARIDIVYEALAILLTITKVERLSCLASTQGSIALSVLADISTTWLPAGLPARLLHAALIHCTIIRHCTIVLITDIIPFW